LTCSDIDLFRLYIKILTYEVSLMRCHPDYFIHCYLLICSTFLKSQSALNGALIRANEVFFETKYM